MSDYQQQGVKKPGSQKGKSKSYDEIRKLVEEGKTDREISAVIGESTHEVYHIRRDILKISNHGRLRICPICHAAVSIYLFNFSKIGQGCLRCRRKEGKDLYRRRNIANVVRAEKRVFGYRKVVCLRCDKKFKSEILSMDGLTYNHLCPQCRVIVTMMERMSI